MICKAAILGTGGMGRRHFASLRELGIPVTAVCDADRAASEKFTADMGIKGAAIFDSFGKMLESADFTILFICLPPFAQDDQFEKAALSGKHIFIEKPIALQTATGARMVRAAKKGGITSMVGFHMRKGAAISRLAQLIQNGEAGKAVLFNAQYQCNSLHTPWWIHQDLSGGQIFEQAIHIYDLCRYFFGDPKFVEGIMANVCHNHLRAYTVEDVSVCLAGFTTGALASITANNCAIPGKWTGKITVVFENLTAEFDDHNHGVITYTKDPGLKREELQSEDNPYFAEVKEFAECSEKGVETSCGIIEGFKSLCFVETAVSSAKLDGVKLPVNTHY
ncbi:MAG: Gfo/Idh/MocA family oxidoreductase [Treponema sp.]|jgi:predicted dehydrogenase|nr:Gfo/Idh/MocA family oxidoreductase [Treponema sp.]